MRMQKISRIGIIMYLSGVVLLGVQGVLLSQENPFSGRGFPGRLFAGINLSEAQRNEIRTLIRGLRDEGKNHGEIREAVEEKLNTWGIDLPEPSLMFGRFRSQMTVEQKEEMQMLIKSMRDLGADRKAIHDAVRDRFVEWGVDVPKRPGRFGDQLTEEQRDALHSMIQEMRDQGDEQEAIHNAVKEKLEGWGVDLPDDWEGRGGMFRFGGKRFGFDDRLTEDQRRALREKITQLKEQGASRQEVHDTVGQLFDEWGIEIPEFRDDRFSQGDCNIDYQQPLHDVNIYPNPFNPETMVSYTLASPSHIILRIYNIQGQLIRTLVDEDKSAGGYTVRWNGRGDSGEMAANGVYIYRLETSRQILSGRMILIK